MRIAARLAPVLVLVAAGCASSPPEHRTVSVELEGSRGRGSASFTSAAVDAVVADLMGGEVQCRATLDPQIRSVLTTLERRGSRARVTVHGDDGRLDARRHGSALELVFSGDDGGRLELEAPWGLAECLLGRTATLGEALAGQRRPSATVRLRPAEGKPLELSVTLE